MINNEGLESVRTMLEADGYLVDVAETDAGRVDVRISAGPDACADCLAPEPIMRGILEKSLGVPEQSIDITYPAEH